jgi:predicted nucleic acid-binding protein
MKGEPAVAARMAGTPRADVGITQVTVAEIEFGLRYLPATVQS